MERLNESEWGEKFEEREKDCKRNVDIVRKDGKTKATNARYKKKYETKKKEFLEFKGEELVTALKQNKMKLTFPNGLIIEVEW